MSELIKKFPEIQLNIAGNGPEKENLLALASELVIEKHICFLGRMSHLQLVDQYRESTLAVFPFVQAKDGDMEGLGLVMIEAMGCECPVVASDIPAVSDVIIDGETGLLVESKNVEDLVIKLENFLIKPEQALAQKGREYVLQTFSWETCAKQYAELISSKIR
jgi:glycosyltransferase involved in cell wall biosynthesis